MPPTALCPAKPDFPKLEEKVLERWRERDIFRESTRRREGAEPYVFYEGPPTANGRPGSHHVLARVFKDIFPRYQTMRGRYVERKGGWDCHGLPVETQVEKQLGFNSKADIEEYGIAEFNAKCRESVFEYLEDWNALTERIGFWVDLEHAYRTLDTPYIESVWWALKTMWDRDLLYEGHRVVPYCKRCGTALSSHEVSDGYQDVEDPSVYVKFPVSRPAGALRDGDTLLVWTTTPWTLVSNAAVAVDPELPYVRTTRGLRARRGAGGARARRGRAGRRPLPRRRHARRRVRAAVPVHPGVRVRREGSHRPARATSSRPRTAPASSTRRSRSARTTSGSAPSRDSTSSTRSGSTAPTTSGSARTPGAG